MSLEKYDPISRIPDNSKAGITVCLNQDEEDAPFEATVYFKKSGKSAEELRKENAITLTASGKLRLDIGKNGYVEIFAENSNQLKDADSIEDSQFREEE
jgi:hypothetical protein